MPSACPYERLLSPHAVEHAARPYAMSMPRERSPVNRLFIAPLQRLSVWQAL
jgi:hypothetical protein